MTTMIIVIMTIPLIMIIVIMAMQDGQGKRRKDAEKDSGAQRNRCDQRKCQKAEQRRG